MSQETQPFEYPNMMYNEAIAYLEKKWGRKLSPHECHVLVEGYRYGRLIEMQDEVQLYFQK